MTDFLDLDELAGRVDSGALLALPAEYSFVPVSFVLELIKNNIRDLHLLCVPIGGFVADLLIGSGAVAVIEAAAVSLGEFGLAPRFSAAIENGCILARDSTCPAVHTALQAAEKGVPFIPLGGLIGSDITANRDDWKIVDDPLERGGGPIVLIPAIRPDVAVFHAPIADRDGNVWVGKRRELVTMAHAAKSTLVTVEGIVEHSLLSDDMWAAGTLPSLYIDAICEVPKGAWPLGLTGYYAKDSDTLVNYARAAKTDAGFADFLKTVLL